MRQLSPRAILVIGWLVFMLYAYPGYMNSEAVDQLIDARYGQFTDWHSPMLTEVWRVVGFVVSGPAGMLVLQSLLVLVGGYRLLRRAMSERAAAIAMCGVLVFPPVIATMGLVCPEALLAGCFLVGLDALRSPRRALKLVGLGLLVIGSAMRPGGSPRGAPRDRAGVRLGSRSPAGGPLRAGGRDVGGGRRAGLRNDVAAGRPRDPPPRGPPRRARCRGHPCQGGADRRCRIFRPARRAGVRRRPRSAAARARGVCEVAQHHGRCRPGVRDPADRARQAAPDRCPPVAGARPSGRVCGPPVAPGLARHRRRPRQAVEAARTRARSATPTSGIRRITPHVTRWCRSTSSRPCAGSAPACCSGRTSTSRSR